MTSRSITDRMFGALRLNEATYEEVEADPKATGEAAFIIVATSLLSGAVNGVFTGVSGGFVGSLGSFLGWALYAWVAYIVGVKLFPGQQTKSSWAEIARTLGYANTPRFLFPLGFVFGLPAITLLVGLWVLVATVVALRSALDITTGRAIVVAIASTFGQFLIIAIALAVAVALMPVSSD